jgi:hypothetical protein
MNRLIRKQVNLASSTNIKNIQIVKMILEKVLVKR